MRFFGFDNRAWQTLFANANVRVRSCSWREQIFGPRPRTRTFANNFFSHERTGTNQIHKISSANEHERNSEAGEQHRTNTKERQCSWILDEFDESSGTSGKMVLQLLIFNWFWIGLITKHGHIIYIHKLLVPFAQLFHHLWTVTINKYVELHEIYLTLLAWVQSSWCCMRWYNLH